MIMISIIVPIFNEAENIVLLYEQIILELDKSNILFEVIFVNDGSRDRSLDVLKAISNSDSRIKVISFRRNFGQTAALSAGIDYSVGKIIIPMDGDLQNDAKDIMRLFNKINEGFDVVSGWRKNRKDSSIKRKLPSVIANKLISYVSGVHLHDYGCSLKAYRREIIELIKLYGEMHRFIPIYASWMGAKVTEISVAHHPRIHGESKYGLERIIKVLLDLLVIKFLAKYATKPIYIFGGFGILLILFSFFFTSWAVYLKIFGNTSFIQTPLILVAVTTFVTGIMSILLGLLAEVVMRTYYESQDKPSYLIKETYNLD
jgi:glycosyltransferase involved in cell wall biosynthesis